MSTVTVSSPAAQPLLPYHTADGGFDHEAYQRDRRAKVAAERTRDLLPLTSEPRRASLDMVTDVDGGSGHYNGIYFVVDENGETVCAGLDDVEDFVEHYGAPATHEHAAKVWEDVREEAGALREIDQAIADWIEECRESYDGLYKSMGDY